jgi:ATP synthase F1 complex assembly factor 1
MHKFTSSIGIAAKRRHFATIVPEWFLANMKAEERYALQIQHKLQKMGIGNIAEFKMQKDSKMQRVDLLEKRKYATMPERMSKNKPLGAILHLDKVKNQDAETIGTLWKRYHADKDLLCAVVPLETYDKMMENGAKIPTFLLPLPRDNDGVEFFVLQFSPPAVLFVSLHEYQTLGPARAKPALRLEHFTELAEDKKIVLMRGEVDDALLGRTLTLADAQILALSMQTYYVNPNSRKQVLLDTFVK